MEHFVALNSGTLIHSEDSRKYKNYYIPINLLVTNGYYFSLVMQIRKNANVLLGYTRYSNYAPMELDKYTEMVIALKPEYTVIPDSNILGVNIQLQKKFIDDTKGIDTTYIVIPHIASKCANSFTQFLYEYESSIYRFGFGKNKLLKYVLGIGSNIYHRVSTIEAVGIIEELFTLNRVYGIQMFALGRLPVYIEQLKLNYITKAFIGVTSFYPCACALRGKEYPSTLLNHNTVQFPSNLLCANPKFLGMNIEKFGQAYGVTNVH